MDLNGVREHLPTESVGQFLSDRQFQRHGAGGIYASRVVAHPRLEVGQTIGAPVWHFIQLVPSHRGSEYRACMNKRGGDNLVMEWTSPWFDSIEACYVYAEINQWGM